MAAAVRADDLRATPVRVRMPLHASLVFFVETWPAAARLEFGLRRIEGVVAATADERAGRIELLVLARERSFRALVDDDSLFVG